jgi:circadian clock protein KaiB
MIQATNQYQVESTQADKAGAQDEVWELRLYISGQTEKSALALANLKKIAEEYLAGRYRIEVVDAFKNPQLAKDDQIVALPALIRRLPPPLRRIVGDLSRTERVLIGLDLKVERK